MSIVGLPKVIDLIQTANLITNLGGRDVTDPEGCGIDLRLGAVHKMIEGGAFIEADGEAGLGRRKGVKTEEVARFEQGQGQQPALVIKPGEYYLVQTVEGVTMPDNLAALFVPRSSLFRAGLQFLPGKADPGYVGPLTFGLTNLSPFEVTLQMGARICNVIFLEIEGGSIAYRGQHQGGRVSPHEEERQV